MSAVSNSQIGPAAPPAVAGNVEIDECPISFIPYSEIQYPVRILNVNDELEKPIYEKAALEDWKKNPLCWAIPRSPITRLEIKDIIDCEKSPSSPLQQESRQIVDLQEPQSQESRQIVDLQEPQSQENGVHLKFSQKVLKSATKAGIFALKVLASIALTLTMAVGYTLIGAICGLVIPGALIGIIFGTLAGIRISQN
ncbi:MAG: hypothetical protein FJZ60_00410, partial [Chlamydiae bacterium]|nr:hypothetical protein [Chlamydiota bacterium]